MQTTGIASDTVFHDFWESSSLHELNAAAFGNRVLRFEPVDRGVAAFAGNKAGVPLAPVRDRFQRTLAGRRSGRRFTDAPLRRRDVERILASVGADAGGNRLIPSAGGLSAVHTFGVGNNVDGPCGGLTFRYDEAAHAVQPISDSPSGPDLRRLFQLDSDGDPQLVLVFVADLEVVLRKYGDRGARFVLQEAGHAAQNVSLRLAHDGLSGYVLGGALDREVLSLLRLAHLDAAVVAAMACGR